MTPPNAISTGGGKESSIDQAKPALEFLRSRQSQFSQALEARLSNYLRADFSLNCAALDVVPFKRMTQSFGQSAHITLFKLEPLRGVCLLNMNPRLGLAMVDRLMGGPGKAMEQDRPLSEIDAALLDQITGMLLQEWCAQWASIQDLRPTILGHEDGIDYLQTSTPETLMLSATLEAQMGDCAEYIELGFPLPALQPLLRACAEQFPLRHEREVRPQAVSADRHPVREHTAIQLTAGATGLELTARQLVGLKIGDVLPLDEAFANAVRLTGANSQQFIGRLGTQERHWAVEIQDVLES